MSTVTNTFICPACGQERDLSDQTHGSLIPSTIATAIQQKHPNWSTEEVVCRNCVNEGKVDEMRSMLEAEAGTLSDSQIDVLESILQDGLLSANTEDEFERETGFSEQLAHRLVATVGSWPFAIGILTFIASWLLINLLGRPFNPYPMVVLAGLSAVLASLAGLQGPIIVMSQRYQHKRDRLRSRNEYRINLKAELEIQYLTEQMDQVLKNQYRLLKALTDLQSESKSGSDQELSVYSNKVEETYERNKD